MTTAHAPLILPYKDRLPLIAAGTFIAPSAILIGDVIIAPGASVWFGCVLRGDEQGIRVGENSNIQDLTLIHTSRGGPDAQIGANVTVGHSAVIHGCVIHDLVLIGMGAIVLDEAVIETGAMVAAGAVVPPGKRVGPGELWAGCPAKKIGDVNARQRESVLSTPPHYRRKAAAYVAALSAAVRE